jgi:hypothetical protein
LSAMQTLLLMARKAYFEKVCYNFSFALYDLCL